MTNHEAIQFLKNMQGEENGRAIGAEGFYAELCGYHVQALGMAIKALEQEQFETIHGSTYGGVSFGGTFKQQQPCEDAISRQAAIEEIRFGQSFITKIYPTGEIEHLFDKENKALEAAVERIMALPPVTPKHRTGHWILRDDINGQYQCDECGMFSGLSKFDVEEEGWKLSNFCSNCGAKMQEVEE